MNNLVGKRFGKLTVVACADTAYSKNGYSYKMWRCKCDCGNYKNISTGNLVSGNTKSCGCYRVERNVSVFTTHGRSKSKLYRVWASIKDRCYRQECAGFKDYGARGIRMCKEWKNNFQSFYDWAIANNYKDGLTIERKDVNGNYCPDNCCWIPKEQQSRNRRNSHFITYHGETKTLSEWSRELHIDRGSVRSKEKELGSGELAIEAILNSPRHKRLESEVPE